MTEFDTGFARGATDAINRNGFFIHRLRLNTEYANGYRVGYYKNINK